MLLTHGDSVKEGTVAPGFSIVAKTAENVAGTSAVHFLSSFRQTLEHNLGIANEEKKVYGLQFHPEVDLTPNGAKMFNNFLRKIAGLHATYTLENRENACIAHIREIVGNKKVLAMVSGGVDSTVCAALLHRALGAERVVAIHIDNGFMRKNESKNVVESLNALGLDVKSFNYTDEFLNARVILRDNVETPQLRNVVNPEEKRMIIGDTFIRCKDHIIQRVG